MNRITRRGFVESAGLIAAGLPLFGIRAEGAQQSAAALIQDPTVERDVVYGKGGDIDLHLDIYHPRADMAPRKMAIVHVHGGGFTGGNKSGVAGSARAFAELGYVGISSQYRFAGQARWPAQLEDVKAAIRWTRANAARLGIDPDKIAVAGYSAGGLMALAAAGTGDRSDLEGNSGTPGISSKVAGCASYFAATAGNNLFPQGTDPGVIAAIGAVNYISPAFAPTILFHGLGDTTIRPESTIDFFQKLRAQGVKTELHLLQAAPHEYVNNNPDAALLSAQAANLFFDRLVIHPREYPAFGAGRGARGARGARGGAPQGGAPRSSAPE
jgi:acetyl esterase/lipase